MLKEIRNMLKNCGDFFTTKDKLYMDDVCDLYEPVINYPMSAQEAKEILEVIGQIKGFGYSNQRIIGTLKSNFHYAFCDQWVKDANELIMEEKIYG